MDVEALAQQIGAKELKFAGFRLIKVTNGEEECVVVKKGTKQLVIKYDEGTDLYDLEMNGEKRDGVYWEDLKGIIERFFKFEYVMDRLRIVGVNA